MFNFESFVLCLEGVVHFAVAGFEPTFDFSFSLVLATVNHKRVRNKAHTAEYRDTCRTRKVKRSRIEEAGRGNGVMEQWSDGAMERWSVGVMQCAIKAVGPSLSLAPDFVCV